MSLLLQNEANGSELSPAVLENIVWTLRIVGFDRQVLTDILELAAKGAEQDSGSVLGKYLPAEKSVKRSGRSHATSGN